MIKDNSENYDISLIIIVHMHVLHTNVDAFMNLRALEWTGYRKVKNCNNDIFSHTTEF